MPIDRVDIVVPVYRNRETLLDLVQEVLAVAANEKIDARFVFVDDACPERSTDVLATLDPRRITLLHQPENTGQQAAIRRGLLACGDHPVIVMDADQQDPPEAIPLLLAKLGQGGFDAVFVTRQGRYQSGPRRLTAWAFRAVLRRLVPVPAGAGSYVGISAALVRKLQCTQNPRFYLAGLIGWHAHRIGAVTAERRTRRSGRSAYTGAMRWSTGLSNIVCILDERTKYATVTNRTRET